MADATEMAINGGISLNFLYQLIGQKEVEKAILVEQVIGMRAELAEIRSAMAETSAAPVDNANAGAAECDSRPESPPEPTD